MNYKELRREVLALPTSYRKLLLNDLIRGYSHHDLMKHNERECREKYEAYLDVFVLLLGCRYDRKIIASHSRIRPLPLVRMILFHQLKREGFSPTCIGVATEFNHSSIFHGEKMVNDIIAHPNYDPEVFDLYTKFHEAIKDKEDDED